MKHGNQPRTLDVGQCDADHRNIRGLLSGAFDAVVDRSRSLDEAVEAVQRGAYDLVLVNRILDADGTEGIELIRRLQADPATRDTPVMLVSNFSEAQKSALDAGAKPGFGKDALDSPATIELLASHLGR